MKILSAFSRLRSGAAWRCKLWWEVAQHHFYASSHHFYASSHNRRVTEGDRRILILRESRFHRYFYKEFLDWMTHRYPSALSHFELQTLPCRIPDWTRIVLCHAWLQDPVRERSP